MVKTVDNKKMWEIIEERIKNNKSIPDKPLFIIQAICPVCEQEMIELINPVSYEWECTNCGYVY